MKRVVLSAIVAISFSFLRPLHGFTPDEGRPNALSPQPPIEHAEVEYGLSDENSRLNEKLIEIPLGDMLASSKHTVGFVLTNKTSETLEIDHVEVTCGCIVAAPSSRIATTGKAIRIQITVSSGSQEGQYEKHVNLFMKIGKDGVRQVRLKCIGDVRLPISFGQQRIVLLRSKASKTLHGGYQWTFVARKFSQKNYINLETSIAGGKLTSSILTNNSDTFAVSIEGKDDSLKHGDLFQLRIFESMPASSNLEIAHYTVVFLNDDALRTSPERIIVDNVHESRKAEFKIILPAGMTPNLESLATAIDGRLVPSEELKSEHLNKRIVGVSLTVRELAPGPHELTASMNCVGADGTTYKDLRLIGELFVPNLH